MSADRAVLYATQALAHAGFAILHWAVAVRLRPDLFRTGVDAGAGLTEARRHNRLGCPEGATRVTAELRDVGTVEVWTWSVDELARRITAGTGFEVVALRQHEQALPPRPVVPRTAAAGVNGDRYAGVVTREPARTCSDCASLRADHRCGAPEVSGVPVPAARVPRRCLGFEPLWDALDQRRGRALWPELEEVADERAPAA